MPYLIIGVLLMLISLVPSLLIVHEQLELTFLFLLFSIYLLIGNKNLKLSLLALSWFVFATIIYIFSFFFSEKYCLEDFGYLSILVLIVFVMQNVFYLLNSKKIIQLLGIAFLLNFVISIIDKYCSESIAINILSILENNNQQASLLLILFPFFYFSKSFKYSLKLFVTASMLFWFYILDANGAILVFFMMLTILVFLKFRRPLVSICLLIFVVGSLFCLNATKFTEHYRFSSRMDIMLRSLELITDNPVYGYGNRNYIETLYSSDFSDNYLGQISSGVGKPLDFHNLYLKMFFCFGVFGFILFFLPLLPVLYRLFLSRKSNSESYPKLFGLIAFLGLSLIYNATYPSLNYFSSSFILLGFIVGISPSSRIVFNSKKLNYIFVILSIILSSLIFYKFKAFYLNQNAISNIEKKEVALESFVSGYHQKNNFKTHLYSDILLHKANLSFALHEEENAKTLYQKAYRENPLNEKLLFDYCIYAIASNNTELANELLVNLNNIQPVLFGRSKRNYQLLDTFLLTKKTNTPSSFLINAYDRKINAILWPNVVSLDAITSMIKSNYEGIVNEELIRHSEQLSKEVFKELGYLGDVKYFGKISFFRSECKRYNRKIKTIIGQFKKELMRMQNDIPTFEEKMILEIQL